MSLQKPNWNDLDDRKLYEELYSKKDKTEEEKIFFNKMYHFEEFICGLDG